MYLSMTFSSTSIPINKLRSKASSSAGSSLLSSKFGDNDFIYNRYNIYTYEYNYIHNIHHIYIFKNKKCVVSFDIKKKL